MLSSGPQKFQEKALKFFLTTIDFLGAKAPLGLVHVMLCYVNPKKFQNCWVLLKLLDNLGFVKGVKNITRGFLIVFQGCLMGGLRVF